MHGYQDEKNLELRINKCLEELETQGKEVFNITQTETPFELHTTIVTISMWYKDKSIEASSDNKKMFEEICKLIDYKNIDEDNKLKLKSDLRIMFNI